jgi:acyl carrier protein
MPPPDSISREHQLIAVVRELVRELHPQRARVIDVSGSSRLERDLGIDSLGRTELILRIERAFRVRLPGAIVGEAETVSDLLHALEQAHPRRLVRAETTATPALPLVPAATEARTLVDILDWQWPGTPSAFT